MDFSSQIRPDEDKLNLVGGTAEAAEKAQEIADKASKEAEARRTENLVRTRKASVESTKEDYEYALSQDNTTPIIPNEGPEVTRTRTLYEQAQRELSEAELYLQEQKGENKGGSQSTPAVNQPVEPAKKQG